MPNKFNTSTLLSFIILLFLTLSIFPQSYLITKYSTDNGLPDNRVNDIAQDSLGRIWVAMVSGVAMYDGYEWTKYGEIDGVPEVEYDKIKIDKKGIIWFLPKQIFGQSLLFNEAGVWKKFSLDSKANSSRSYTTSFEVFYLNHKLEIYISKINNGLIRYRNASWSSIKRNDGLICDTISKILNVGDKIYVATYKGLSIFDRNNKIKNLQFDKPSLSTTILGASLKNPENIKSDSVMIFGNNWIGFICNDKITTWPLDLKLPHLGMNESYFISSYSDEIVLFGNLSTIYQYNFTDSSSTKIILENPQSDRGGSSILIDYEKNIWVPTLRGIYKLTLNPFKNYIRHTGLPETEVSAISQFNDGEIVFGYNHGVSILKNKKLEFFKIGSAEGKNINISRIIDIYHDKLSDLIYLVSVQNGVGILNKNGIIEWKKFNLPTKYSTIYPDPKRGYIVYTDKGFFSLTNDFKFLTKNYFLIRRVLKIKDDEYLLGSASGVYRWEIGNKQLFWIPHTENISIYSILNEKKLGTLFGTLKGLMKLENDSLYKFNFNDQVINDPIYFIIQDSTKNIWLGTNNGILKWDGKNLKRYNKSDGLAGNETNRAAGFVDSKGNVWIGTDEGVSMYTGNEPDYSAFIPKMMLLNFKDHSNFSYSTKNEVNVDPDKNNLTFYYRGLSFIDEKRNSYQIKLAEIDGDYFNEFTTRSTSARFNNLAPGDYIFSVRVKNSKGIWSDWKNSSVITVKKFFYQELIFQLGVMGLFLFIAYSFYNYVQQKKYTKKLEQAVDLRTKDLRETQDQLITSANRYKGIIESQSDLVVRITETGILTFVNDAYCSIFGKNQDQLIGKSFVPLVHPDDLTPTFEEIKKLKDYPYRGTIEQRGLTINGYRWYSWEGYAIRDQFGKILEIQAVGRDITLQKEIENELEKRVTERTVELQSLISQSPLGILTFDSEGNLITFNKVANQMYNFLDEYIGTEYNYNLFNDEFLIKTNYSEKLFNLDAPHGFLLTPPIRIDSVSNKIYSKLFNHFLVYRIYIVKFDENNKTYVMLVDDVTEQKNTEEVSKRLLEEKIRISTIFKTIESERERFAKELHDGLGQLLTTAKLKLDIIKLKTDKSIVEINDTVNLLINAGDEIRRIISDLKPSDVENFGLASSIELLIERTRQASGINIILAILSTKEFKNKTTEIIIYRVIQEALNNIVKHSKSTNALIELSTTDSELQLNIIDDGVGVDLSKLNEKIKSYGIHNIKERVNSLNGIVEIETKPEKGFKYHITIPI